MEPLRIEIIVHPGGPGAPDGLPRSRAAVAAEEHAAHVASGLPATSTGAEEVAKAYDRAQLVAALETAHRREHQLVEEAKQANDLLRQRTIERDHFLEDSLLWGLVVAYYVDRDGDAGELELASEDVNRWTGTMIDAHNDADSGVLTIRLKDRPQASEEGGHG